MTAKVAELTVDELRELLQEAVREIVEERLGMLADPDDDLELKDEVAQSLREYLASERRGDDAEEAFHTINKR